jgi:hypothetical protein
MSDFDLAPDGKRAAFSSLNEQGSSRVWIAALDHRTPPQQVTSIESDNPSFGPSDTLFFRGREGDSDIVYGVELSDTKPRRIRWLLMRHPVQSAQPVRGGPKIRICDFCEVGWGRMASTSTSVVTSETVIGARSRGFAGSAVPGCSGAKRQPSTPGTTS